MRSIPAVTDPASAPSQAGAADAKLTLDDIIRQAGGAANAPGRNDPLP
ncbi:hypothetical protein ACWKWN_19365 [Microbacterium trichothecenolyticum]